MIIYPAIDIRHGKTVQLVGGDPTNVAIDAGSPESQAIRFRTAGAMHAHVVDLDAALGGAHQWPMVEKVIRTGLQVQFGGGIRSMVQVQQLLNLGIRRVIIGTQGVQNPDWLRELAGLFPEKIVLAIDARGRDVAVKGWTESAGKDVVELAASLDDAGLAGFLYTNVAKEGRLEGIDVDVIQDLRNACGTTPLIVSGGISSDADLEILEGLGVDGAVLGMSIYTGAIDLAKALHRHGPTVDGTPVTDSAAQASKGPDGAPGQAKVNDP